MAETHSFWKGTESIVQDSLMQDSIMSNDKTQAMISLYYQKLSAAPSTSHMASNQVNYKNFGTKNMHPETFSDMRALSKSVYRSKDITPLIEDSLSKLSVEEIEMAQTSRNWLN